MKICKDYYFPINLTDAIDSLASAPGKATIVAGGTDLLLDIQQERHPVPDLLVDVTRIPELNMLELRGEQIFIGAAVPHNQITASPLLCQHAQALVEACGLIGGPQVRNVASLGGNVGHALPAADGTIALMALNARAEIANQNGLRSAPLAELFKGPGQNTLAKDEIITGFYLPLAEASQASAFQRVMRPQGVAIAILNCAVWLQREVDEVADIRISIGPSGPTPRRLAATENVLRGQPLSSAKIDEAVSTVLDEASFRTSRHRATQGYRREVADVLLRGCLETAWARAEEGSQNYE